MTGKRHTYSITVRWTGNLGPGTSGYRDYARDHETLAPGKPAILGSSDPGFRGDPSRWNPEELLVASLSSCHKLWYLHLCSVNGVRVIKYEDAASGVMVETADGAGQFEQVTLRPHATITADCDAEIARQLHHEANAMCFIARSVNFPVTHEPKVTVADAVIH